MLELEKMQFLLDSGGEIAFPEPNPLTNGICNGLKDAGRQSIIIDHPNDIPFLKVMGITIELKQQTFRLVSRAEKNRILDEARKKGLNGPSRPSITIPVPMSEPPTRLAPHLRRKVQDQNPKRRKRIY